MRPMAGAVALLFVLVPSAVTGQTSFAASAPSDAGAEGRERLSLQVAAGPSLVDAGNVLSAAFGYSPTSRLDLLLNVERDHMAFQFERFNGHSNAIRGGAMRFVSGEVRLALRPADRVSPFAVAGVGGGVSRPNVNDRFPDRGTTNVLVLYIGGGVRVPLGGRFSLLSDARMIFEVENQDGVPAVWPVRVGLAFRF
jgi:opacity protein-like surface antigen